MPTSKSVTPTDKTASGLRDAIEGGKGNTEVYVPNPELMSDPRTLQSILHTMIMASTAREKRRITVTLGGCLPKTTTVEGGFELKRAAVVKKFGPHDTKLKVNEYRHESTGCVLNVACETRDVVMLRMNRSELNSTNAKLVQEKEEKASLKRKLEQEHEASQARASKMMNMDARIGQ